MTVRDELTESLRPFELDANTLFEVMCETLAIQCTGQTSQPQTDPASLAEFAANIQAVNADIQAMFDASGIDRKQAYADLKYLMQTTAGRPYAAQTTGDTARHPRHADKHAHRSRFATGGNPRPCCEHANPAGTLRCQERCAPPSSTELSRDRSLTT